MADNSNSKCADSQKRAPSTVSGSGLALIKKSEGLRLKTYLDVAGFPTIGYGHKLPVAIDPITEAQADELLRRDVAAAESAVNRLVKVPLSQGQFDALVDFVFNLGATRLAGSTLLADLNVGKYDAAAGQLLCWDHAGHTELQALKERREAELVLWSGK